MTKYSFDGRRLIVQDPSLGLNFDEPFIPLLIPEKPDHGFRFSDGSLLLCEMAREHSIEKLGLREGQYKIMYPGGKLKVECYYLDGLLHGPSYFYSEEGQELSLSWYIRGKKEGVALTRYSSGALYSRQQFIGGREEGKQEYYYPDGKLKSRLFYQKGRLLGEQECFHRDGTSKLRSAVH